MKQFCYEADSQKTRGGSYKYDRKARGKHGDGSFASLLNSQSGNHRACNNNERLQNLKFGLDTPLKVEFEENGVNLSSGEAQKIAISRAFYKDSSLIILDEPSSALDPIAEYHLTRSMLEAAANKINLMLAGIASTVRNRRYSGLSSEYP